MMPRRRSRAEVWDAAHETAERLHDQDEKAAAVAQRERTQGTTLLLEQILDRETDTRPLQSQHVTQLAESISVLGLIEPLVVDNRGRLLAGGHRKAAIASIRENNPQAYAQHFRMTLFR
jgi:ParB family chromosome partitioning protein